MDEQSFYHPSPNSIAAAPEVLPPLDPISSSVDLSHEHSYDKRKRDFSRFRCESGYAPYAELVPPSTSAASPFDPPGFPQLNAFSPDTTVMMNENDGFHQFLMMPDPDVCDKSTSHIHSYSHPRIAFFPRLIWGISGQRLGVRVKCVEPARTYHLRKYGIPCCCQPEDYPELFDLWPEEVVPFPNQLY